jgi:hypothetical protein
LKKLDYFLLEIRNFHGNSLIITFLAETQDFQFIDEDVETTVSDDDKSWVDGNSNGGFNWGRINGGFMPSRSQTTSLASMNAIRKLSRNPSRTTADLYGIDPSRLFFLVSAPTRDMHEVTHEFVQKVLYILKEHT